MGRGGREKGEGGAAYATERGAKMADEEAEQESGSLGGDRLELRRLRERLLELETGLRESAEPAAQAAAEYCQQLCQVGPPPLPPPSVCVCPCPCARAVPRRRAGERPLGPGRLGRTGGGWGGSGGSNYPPPARGAAAARGLQRLCCALRRGLSRR